MYYLVQIILLVSAKMPFNGDMYVHVYALFGVFQIKSKYIAFEI